MLHAVSECFTFFQECAFNGSMHASQQDLDMLRANFGQIMYKQTAVVLVTESLAPAVPSSEAEGAAYEIVSQAATEAEMGIVASMNLDNDDSCILRNYVADNFATQSNKKRQVNAHHTCQLDTAVTLTRSRTFYRKHAS
jgi:hypothetical protein